MFGRSHSAAPTDRAPYARGTASAASILTGVVVATGATFLLLAIIGGILVALDYVDVDVTQTEAVEVGIGAGIAFVIAQFLAYLWGGYTAGRMGRGAGFLNGLAVPIVSILLALIIGGLVTALGADARLNLPFAENRLPVEQDYVVDWGVGIGIVSLAAMFLGGILGGIAGSHWHTKLERKVYEDEQERALEENETLRRNEIVTTADRPVVAPTAQTDSTATQQTTVSGPPNERVVAPETTEGTSTHDTTTDGTDTRTFRS
jgi:hypothetical protein